MTTEAPAPPEPQEEYICAYCLSITIAGFSYPETCTHCNVGYCDGCKTRLKTGVQFCHGCGAIPPKVTADFYRASSTSGFYRSRDWALSGIGPDITRVLTTSHGFDSVGEMKSGAPAHHRLVCDSYKDGDGHWQSGLREAPVRDLTPEEVKLLWRGDA